MEVPCEFGNPFADESFEVDGDNFLDMRTTTTTTALLVADDNQQTEREEPDAAKFSRRRSSNPFVSPENFLVDSRLQERLQASVLEDNFRSTIPDDEEFHVTSGSPLFVPSPESNLVPITTEKEEILSNFKQYNLDSDELQLISKLPDAVAKATLDQLQRRQAEAGSGAPELPEERGLGDWSPESDHDVHDHHLVAVEEVHEEADAFRPVEQEPEREASVAEEQDYWPRRGLERAPEPEAPPLAAMAKVEAIDDRLQHIEEVVVSLKRKESDPVVREKELSLIKDQQMVIAQKDEAIAGLVKDKEELYLRLRDMMDEKEVNAAMSAREQSSLEEVSNIVNEYEARLKEAKSEKNELVDRIEYLLGERRDYNKLESAFEALRNDNIHLQEAIGDERHRCETLMREVREYAQVQHEASAACVEYKSKFEKAESDVDSLKSYIVECNTANYNQRIQMDDLVRENKLLQATIVNLKLDLTNQDEELSRLSREVKVLEASKQKLLLSPQKMVEVSRPRDNLGIIPSYDAHVRPSLGDFDFEVQAHRAPAASVQVPVAARIEEPPREVLTPKSMSNRDTIENIYDHIRRGHRQYHGEEDLNVAMAEEREPLQASKEESLASRQRGPERVSEEAAPTPSALERRNEAKENIIRKQADIAINKQEAKAANAESARRPSHACPYAVEGDKSSTFNSEQKIERQLLKMNMEKQFLESQYAKMPASSGRTLAQRKQKREIEERLNKLNKEISSNRLALKRLTSGRG
ncbi:hypothetical protein HOP50_04g34450 [Chloropicon primus]|uniref:Uncharacterized protein n=1 Tax=Chloropicon primus TaxID=1764295 RepID=A0A5B8MKX1_9CHLO|nr:hypothetical protein A3770_04p34390 [Chloropicon primus]UPR00131.1 hypothetical protein HOP50_04g34450 [Chloropicon primus]|eukprot:QDZ20921.1 hypothetical protein A3770_04p34390 [Chloropicon primus]